MEGQPALAYDNLPQDGMTLRDWFAGQALAGIIDRDTKHGEEELFTDCPEEAIRSENGDLEMSPRLHVSTHADSYEVVAQAAFAIADAMLAARKEVQS